MSQSDQPRAEQPRVHRINVSRGGVPKRAVTEAHVTRLGIEGDVQANRKYHGGPDRALCLYAVEIIDRVAAEGHPIEPGSTGENITVAGLDWSTLAPGARLRLGSEVEIELTSYTVPCRTIAASFIAGKFDRILQKKHQGESRLYARVLREGRIEVGDAIAILDQAAELKS